MSAHNLIGHKEDQRRCPHTTFCPCCAKEVCAPVPFMVYLKACVYFAMVPAKLLDIIATNSLKTRMDGTVCFSKKLAKAKSRRLYVRFFLHVTLTTRQKGCKKKSGTSTCNWKVVQICLPNNIS